MTTEITLHYAANLNVLAGMTTDSVDAVVGDPPYQVNLNPDVCGWDVWPPKTCWQELARVVKPRGLLAFAIAPHVAHERVPDVVEAGWNVLEVGFWVWGSGRPCHKTRLKRSYDLVYFMSQESRSLYPENARGAFTASTISGRTGKVVGKQLGRQFFQCDRQRVYTCGADDYFPANVACEVGCTAFGTSGYELIFAVKQSRSPGHADETHPTEKPNDLMAQIVKLVSNPSDIVLDPWMGSGTTGVACLALQRRFIGIETEREYFDMAKKKLSQVQVSMFL